MSPKPKSLSEKRKARILPAKAEPSLVKVKLAELQGEELYRLSFFRSWEPLALSFKKIGQTAPLLCRKTKKGLELFSGFLRKSAMLELGISFAFALLWKEQDLSELNAFQFAFFENALGRGLNLAEQARASVRLRQLGISDLEIVRDYFQPAGIGRALKEIDLLIRFSELEQQWQKYLVEKDLKLKQLAWFLHLSQKAQKALSFWLEFNPSASQFRQILEMTEEIIKRDQISIENLVKSLKQTLSLKKSSLNPSERLEKLFLALYQLRFPKWNQLLLRHQSLLKQLKVPQEVKLTPRDFFEEPQYQLELVLEPKTEFHKILEQLSQASQNPTWQKLFKLDEN